MKRHSFFLRGFFTACTALLFGGLPAVSVLAGGGYGAGGCGPGAVLMPKNTIVSQTLAAATNASWSHMVTFGMTSGTSGCNISGFVKNDEQMPVYFAEANLTDLTTEMAQGEGEKLVAFSQTFGCRQEAYPAFAQMTRSQFSTLVPSAQTSPEEVVRLVRVGIRSDAGLAVACSI